MSQQQEIIIPRIQLEFDPEDFPQILTRYTVAELKECLFQMCRKQNLPITKENMESVAADLESDLAGMFG
jgi:hypothetical protein